MVSFKVHLILPAAMSSVCSQTHTERPRACIFHLVTPEFGTCWSGLDIYRQVMGMGTTQDETQVTFSEDYALQGTDLCRFQALFHSDVLHQKCYIYILKANQESRCLCRASLPAALAKL